MPYVISRFKKDSFSVLRVALVSLTAIVTERLNKGQEKMFKQYYIIEKVLVISIFVGKIRLTFHYKKMSEKIYGKLLEKHKNSVFHISKIGKAFSHFDFNSTIRKKIHLVVQLFGNKVIKSFPLTSHTEHLNQFTHVLI